MKKIIKNFSKNFLKFSVIGLSLNTLSIKKINIKCETLKTEEKEEEKKIILPNFKNTNIIIVIGIQELKDEFKNKALHIINKYKKVFPDLEIININSLEELKKLNFDKKIDKDTFLILNKKNDEKILELDHFRVLYEQLSIYNFFKETDVLKNFKEFDLNKFGYVLGYCGENRKGESFIRELSVSKEFNKLNFNLLRFEDCEKLDSSPNDLILLKKNSKYNSLDSGKVKIIEGRKFDIVKKKDFFIKEQEEKSGNEVFKNNKAEFIENLAKDLNEISVYDPTKISPYVSKDYTFLLVIDKNKIQNREKHSIMSKIQKIKSNLPKEIEEKISFQISFSKIKEKNQTKKAFFINEKKEQISMIYSHQNKSSKVQKHLEKNFPFLKKNKKTNFKHEYNLKNLNYDDFLINLLLLEKNELQGYYPSSAEKPFKLSNKLVFNDFGAILKDKKNHCVFFYDQFCESCKSMSSIFEKLAIISIIDKNEKVNFHRVNNSLNSFYMMTPVLTFFKSGWETPFVFNSAFFGEESIKDFIRVTEMAEIVDVDFGRFEPCREIGELKEIIVDN